MEQSRTHTRRDRTLARAVRRRGDDCHLCGEPIDYDLPPGHPQAFEADHIIPVAVGGTSTLDNIAASHRVCNQRKGDGRRAGRPDTPAPAVDDDGCPPGPCEACHGTHHPRDGVTFVTARQWSTTGRR